MCPLCDIWRWGEKGEVIGALYFLEGDPARGGIDFAPLEYFIYGSRNTIVVCLGFAGKSMYQNTIVPTIYLFFGIDSGFCDCPERHLCLLV